MSKIHDNTMLVVWLGQNDDHRPESNLGLITITINMFNLKATKILQFAFWDKDVQEISQHICTLDLCSAVNQQKHTNLA